MASSTSSSSQMPSSGRHPVNIGSSLGRAIKNRKLKGSPAPPTKRSPLPEIDFYSFKFNFKPSSIDAAKAATIEIKKGLENTQVVAEYPTTQPGEAHKFSGSEQPAKDVDCILIFDDETGKFTLEKLDSYVLLSSSGKQPVSTHRASPISVVASSSSSKGKVKQESDVDQTVYGMDDDADGEIEDLEERIPPSISYREEEEEGEEEEIEIPLRQTILPKPQPPQPQPPKAVRPVKPLPKTRVETKAPEATAPPLAKSKPPPPSTHVATPPAPTIKAPAPVPAPPKAKPAPQTKPKKAKPAATPSLPVPASSTSYAAEGPGKSAKRPRPSPPQLPPKPAPPPPAPVALSLPGGPASFAPPPAPASTKISVSSSASRDIPPVLQAAPIVAASPIMIPQFDSSEDEEEWEPVTDNPVGSQEGNPAHGESNLTLEEEIFGDGFASADDGEGEEIDFTEFNKELDEQIPDEQMEDSDLDDDFLAAAVSPEPETRRPMSMSEMASGTANAVGDSDDEFSSSDESDED